MTSPIVAAGYTESTVLADLPTLDGERLVLTDQRHVDADGVNREFGLHLITAGQTEENVGLSHDMAVQLATALRGVA